MQLHEYLRLFSPLSNEDYSLLTGAMHKRSFHKGDHIIMPGQTQKELYFVRSGVQMSYAESDTKIHVIAFTYPPNLCAIPESFSFQTPSTYCLSCLTDSDLDYITYDQLQLLFEGSRSIERLFRRMTEVILAGMINRHIELHAMGMEARYRVFCKRSPHLLQLVPHKYIASYLGIDATNFSKLFNSVKI
jgi:CRP-like cAMP-binding protein